MLHILSSCSAFVSFGILILTRKNLGECNPITNSNFNENIREFSLKEDDINGTEVKTLHMEDPKKYYDSSHFRPMLLKDIPDSKISSSSQSRGLISRDHPGYHIHDYEEFPHGYGYEYHLPHDHNEYDHDFDHYHYGHHGHGHHYVGPYYKHYKHALSAKAVLWPIAGIAILGAAAALVSNPILLQLGVASGKRRRRDTEEDTGPDLEDFGKWNSQEESDTSLSSLKKSRNKSYFQRIALKKNKGIDKTFTTKVKENSIESRDDFEFNAPPSNESDESSYIPVPIKRKDT